MRNLLLALPLALLFAAAAAPSADAADDKNAPPPAWVYPQDLKCGGRRLTVYEPEVTAFDAPKFRVTVRFPAVLTDPLGRAAYGMAETTGTIHVDIASRLMKIDALSAGAMAFPGLPEPDLKSATDGLQDALPKSLLLRLELLTARTGAAIEDTATPKFNMAPPNIVLRLRPTVLLQVDGEPVLGDIENVPMQYVTNTASNVFRDAQTDMWYLLLDGSWLQAKAFAGPWRRGDGVVPTALSQIPPGHPRGHIRKWVPGTPEFGKRGPVATPKAFPEVVITDKPSELVLLAGDPLFTLVPGVRLMCVANTESDLFFHPKSNLYYLLIAGRWFSADEIDAAWTAVEKLPEEFAKIPKDYIRAHVLWSVPGSPEASEACAVAALEERTTVNKFTQVQVLYENKEPVLEKVAEGLKIPANTEDDCFVAGSAFYVCQYGLWYRSEDGRSKWNACAELPPALQKIPEETGSYHVNFCRPMGFEGDLATFSIKGAYYGNYVWRGAPIYGTGVVERGLLRAGNWYPCARTYGENRWYDPGTNVFHPRSVRAKDTGLVADEWSPYTASYGRVVHHSVRYEQGGRRMFQWSGDELKFNTAVARPDVYTVWASNVKRREGLDAALFPLGSRASETPPAEPRWAADAKGQVFRLGAKGPETWEKSAWIAAKPDPAVLAWLETQARLDARPAALKKWREQRAAPIPVNPVVTEKGK